MLRLLPRPSRLNGPLNRSKRPGKNKVVDVEVAPEILKVSSARLLSSALFRLPFLRRPCTSDAVTELPTGYDGSMATVNTLSKSMARALEEETVVLASHAGASIEDASLLTFELTSRLVYGQPEGARFQAASFC